MPERRKSDKSLKRLRFFVWVEIVLTAVAIGWAWDNGLRAADKIQAQRHQACVDQNMNRFNTVNTLDAFLDRAETGLKSNQRKQLEASRVFTVSLINALAPYRDCKKLTS